MSLLLAALLLQHASVTPKFFNDGDRITLRSTIVSLSFRGFTRADMIEIVPVARQDEPSVRVTFAAIRNLILINRDKSYAVTQQTERRSDSLSFTPADFRQDTILIVSVPEGLRLQISYNGNAVPVTGPLKESLFLNDLTVRRGKPGAVIAALNERLRNNEIVLPDTPPANPKAQIIHAERPDLTREDLRILDQLSGDRRAPISFEATVTDTGQVIEVRLLSGISPRMPRAILEKLEDAAMRHSYLPYLVDGKASAFTTLIVLEAQ